MVTKKPSQRLITKVASKKALEQNAAALRAYDYYKTTLNLAERVAIALGRKPAFKSRIESTINFKIDRHGVASTTA